MNGSKKFKCGGLITVYGNNDFCFNRIIKPTDKREEQIKRILAIK